MNLLPLIRRLKIIPKGQGVVSLVPNSSQQRIIDEVQRQHEEKRPIRIAVLKARQVGTSTIVQAIKFCFAFLYKPSHGLTLAHDSEVARHLHEITKLYWETFPFRSAYKARYETKYELVWDFGSSLRIGSAKVIAIPRGRTIHSFHGCLAPGTPIPTDRGVLPIKLVRPGDWVLTHAGNEAKVTATVSKPASEVPGFGELIEVVPWLGEPVRLTPDHRVFTSRGWLPAAELRTGDELCMSLPELTKDLNVLRLPKQRQRAQGGGRQAAKADAEFGLTEDLGFAFGFYLAEGCVLWNRRGPDRWPAAITLSRHEKEDGYADRAVGALSGLSTSHRRNRRRDSKAVVETIYGSRLASFLVDNFGDRGTHMRIPGWVWNAGSDFAAGLLAGYLTGDGSKTYWKSGGYETTVLSATTISPWLAFQVRDLAASLGLGWGSVRTRISRRYGKAGSPTWLIKWSGHSARALRELVGLPTPSGGRAWISKYRETEGRIWLKIRKLSTARSTHVWDLQVDHPDHSFRTLHFAVSNSEVAFWQNPSELMGALAPSIPNAPGTMSILESTANGIGDYWYDLVTKAQQGDSDYKLIFVPWFEHTEYFLRDFPPLGHLDDEEKLLRKGFKLSDAQLAWRRWAIVNNCEGFLDKFHQEFPSTVEEAFVSSGNNLFHVRDLQAVYHSTCPGRSCVPARGFLMRDPNGAIRFQSDSEGPLKIYKAPSRKFEVPYLVSGDPTFTTEGDPAVVQVINRRSYEQVATWEGRIDPISFAEEIAKIGTFYNNALATTEIEGPGYGTVGRLAEIYPRVWGHQRADYYPGFRRGNSLGWSSSYKRKEWAIGWLRKLIRDASMCIHDPRTFEQLRGYGMTAKGLGNLDPKGHDDHVMALAIAVICSVTEGPVITQDVSPLELARQAVEELDL